jgi:hypothetical protein
MSNHNNSNHNSIEKDKKEKEMQELEKEKKRFESHKRETHRRRLRQYEDERRITSEKEKNRARYEKEEEKRFIEEVKEKGKSLDKKRRKIIKNMAKAVIILFFVLILVTLYTILSNYIKEHPNTSVKSERAPIELTYQQIFYLCEEGCKEEGGFMNKYYNAPTEVGCTCINTLANGESVIKIFDKIKVRWVN